MMDVIRQYFLSVVTAAVFCGIVNSLTKKRTSQAVVKLLAGIFLTFTVIRPLAQLDLEDVKLPSFTDDAQYAALEGEILARETMVDIIKSETEAYILDKAGALDAELSVEVFLSKEDTPIPVSVRLSGSISPYGKQRLQAIISSDLGIPEEDQLWME